MRKYRDITKGTLFHEFHKTIRVKRIKLQQNSLSLPLWKHYGEQCLQLTRQLYRSQLLLLTMSFYQTSAIAFRVGLH